MLLELRLEPSCPGASSASFFKASTTARCTRSTTPCSQDTKNRSRKAHTRIFQPDGRSASTSSPSGPSTSTLSAARPPGPFPARTAHAPPPSRPSGSKPPPPSPSPDPPRPPTSLSKRLACTTWALRLWIGMAPRDTGLPSHRRSLCPLRRLSPSRWSGAHSGASLMWRPPTRHQTAQRWRTSSRTCWRQALSRPSRSPSTTSPRASCASWPRTKTLLSERPSRSPSPCTTSQRACASARRSTTPPSPSGRPLLPGSSAGSGLRLEGWWRGRRSGKTKTWTGGRTAACSDWCVGS
mmetsp:Transcript_14641/g.29351  ORF Transcript_14641/g.29351 Transcript_14641/m.29351 type:complete len:295 (+) Transcript_14641:276-1160(+)